MRGRYRTFTGSSDGSRASITGHGGRNSMGEIGGKGGRKVAEVWMAAI